MMHSINDLTTFCRKTTGDVPAKLVGASTTVVGSKMYLFGGRLASERKMMSDLYVFDMETFNWEKVPISPDDDVPRARYFHSADTWNNRLIIFGGMSNQPDSINPEDLCVLNDVRFFDIEKRHWLPASHPATLPELSLPRARYAHLSSVTADRLFIIGGQDFNNTWLDDVCVYDLVNDAWILRRDYPRHCGTYRSVAVSSQITVRSPMDERRSSHSASTLGPPGQRFGPDMGAHPDMEYTPSDALVHLPYSASPTEEHPSDIYLYSNYNFTDVKRELEVFTPLPENDFAIQDKSSAMTGNTFPPGLRFPTGAILGSNLIIAGTYLAHSYQSFSIWVLDLTNMTWLRIDPGKAVETGSWFRGSLWAAANKFVIFGNRNGNLVDDYNRRLLSWDHVAVVDLEAFGVYQPPPLKIDITMQELGLAGLEERVVADFEIICEDGRRIACSRKILEERWPWFLEQRKLFNARVRQALTTIPGGGDSPAHLPMPEINGNASSEEPRVDPRLTSRALELSEPYPILLALLQYFYTTALITPLQHAPAVLSQLLMLSTNYKLKHLEELVKHAMHRALSNSTSVGVYEVATLCSCRSLQIRALKTVMAYTQKRPPRSSRDKDDGKPPGSSGGGSANGGLGPGGPGIDSYPQQFSRPRGTSDARWRTMGSESTSNSGYNTRAVSEQGLGHAMVREWAEDVRYPSSPSYPRSPPVSAPPRAQSSMGRWRSDSVTSISEDLRPYSNSASGHYPAVEPAMAQKTGTADLNHLADLMGVPNGQDFQTLVDSYEGGKISPSSILLDHIRDNQPTPVPIAAEPLRRAMSPVPASVSVPAVAIIDTDEDSIEDEITPLPVLKSRKPQRRNRPISTVSMHTEQEMHELVDLLSDLPVLDPNNANTSRNIIDRDDLPPLHPPSIVTPDAAYRSPYRSSFSPSVAPSLSYTSTDSDYSDGFAEKHESLTAFIRNRPPRIFTDSIQSRAPSLTSSVSTSSLSTGRYTSPATPLTPSLDLLSSNELGIIDDQYARDRGIAVVDPNNPDPYNSSQMNFFGQDRLAKKWPQQASNINWTSLQAASPAENHIAESVASLTKTTSRSTTSTSISGDSSTHTTGSGGALKRLIGRKKDDAHAAEIKEKEKEKKRREKEKREKAKQELEKKMSEKKPKETPQERKARIEELRRERQRKALAAEPSLMGGMLALA